MAEIISLVKGDTVADLQVTLVRDDTGTAFNATGIALTMQIKKKGIDGIVAGGSVTLGFRQGLPAAQALRRFPHIRKYFQGSLIDILSLLS